MQNTNNTTHEYRKMELLAAHEEYVRHVPQRSDRTRCGRCDTPIPCPTVQQQVHIMSNHGHLPSPKQQDDALMGHHACGAWIWPYRY